MAWRPKLSGLTRCGRGVPGTVGAVCVCVLQGVFVVCVVVYPEGGGKAEGRAGLHSVQPAQTCAY